MYQLALCFAMLQHSSRAVVDPTPLIESLGLKKGDQQDAAEYASPCPSGMKMGAVVGWRWTDGSGSPSSSPR
jgi:hypothetical protein